MTDHNLGEEVLKETKIKTKDGKEKSIGDMARNSWGVPPKGDAAKKDAQQPNADKAGTEIGHELAHQQAERVGAAQPDQHERLHAGATRGPADKHEDLHTGKLNKHEDLHAGKLDKHGDNTAEHQKDVAERQHQLVEASKRIKTLNNEMHKPGGPLAQSDLELVGFDKAGRLLLIHRDKGGHVDGKYLVDHESGQIVAKTKEGHLDKWDKSPDYDRKAREHGDRPKDWHSEAKEGATVWRDKHDQVREVTRANGDNIHVTRNDAGKVTEININYAARDGKSGKVEQFKIDEKLDVVAQAQGIKEPWQKMKDSAQKADVLEDGTLQLQMKDNERRALKPDGSTVESKQINGQYVVTQVADAYGDKRTYNWDEKANKPTEINVIHADKTTDTYKPGSSIHGVQQDFWYKYPQDPKEQAKGLKFEIHSDGALVQYAKSNDYTTTKPDGSIVHTTPTETQIVRPAFKPGMENHQNVKLNVSKNIAPEIAKPDEF